MKLDDNKYRLKQAYAQAFAAQRELDALRQDFFENLAKWWDRHADGLDETSRFAICDEFVFEACARLGLASFVVTPSAVLLKRFADQKKEAEEAECLEEPTGTATS